MHVLYDILNVGGSKIYVYSSALCAFNESVLLLLNRNMVWGFCCGKSSTTNSYSFNTLARQKTVL